MYGNVNLGDCHAAVSGVLPYIKERSPAAVSVLTLLSLSGKTLKSSQR